MVCRRRGRGSVARRWTFRRPELGIGTALDDEQPGQCQCNPSSSRHVLSPLCGNPRTHALDRRRPYGEQRQAAPRFGEHCQVWRTDHPTHVSGKTPGRAAIRGMTPTLNHYVRASFAITCWRGDSLDRGSWRGRLLWWIPHPSGADPRTFLAWRITRFGCSWLSAQCASTMGPTPRAVEVSSHVRSVTPHSALVAPRTK